MQLSSSLERNNHLAGKIDNSLGEGSLTIVGSEPLSVMIFSCALAYDVFGMVDFFFPKNN